jgi:hypothetical protein
MKNAILFGNGLNRLLASNISWGQLLDKIKGSNKFKDDILPNTMIYERIVLQRLSKHKDILKDEFEVKSDIGLVSCIRGSKAMALEVSLQRRGFVLPSSQFCIILSIVACRGLLQRGFFRIFTKFNNLTRISLPLTCNRT